MTAIPPSFSRADESLLAHGDMAGVLWATLSEAGALVASLAQMPAAEPVSEDEFHVLLGEADSWRREQASTVLTDLIAVMEPGIQALLAIRARGADSGSAAQALLREYRTAHDAVLALLRPLAAA